MDMEDGNDALGGMREQELEPPSFAPSEDDEVYGRMERQLAFKLLAAHGMMDWEFFNRLRADPALAASQLRVRLNQEDIAYLRDTVDWDELARHWEGVRTAIQPEAVVRSLW